MTNKKMELTKEEVEELKKKFVSYHVQQCEKTYCMLHGIKTDREGYIRKWIGYNQFEEKETKIPENALPNPREDKEWWIEKYKLGTRKVFKIDEKFHEERLGEGWKHYFIHDNGGRAFVVFLFSPSQEKIEKQRTVIYARDEKRYYYDDDLSICPELYTRQILDIEVEEVFIGRSPKNKMTEYSGGFGPAFDGNSILLHVKDLEYIYIGSIIYSFTTRSHVTKFVSPVGNSDVPYPYAYDDDGNCYLLIEDVMMTDFKLEKGQNPYYYYYGHYRMMDRNFRFDDEIVNMTFKSHPDVYYDLVINEWKHKIYLDDRLLPKEEFVKINDEFGKEKGYFHLSEKKMIEKRQW